MKKNNRLLNILTVLVILVIAASAAAAVRNIRDKAQEKVTGKPSQTTESSGKADLENIGSQTNPNSPEKVGENPAVHLSQAQTDGTASAGQTGPQADLAAGSSSKPDSGELGTSAGDPDGYAGSSGNASGLTCSFQIICPSLLDHTDQLKKEKRAFVPADGVIIPERTVAVRLGETVYDLTKRLCDDEGILIESVYMPLYESYSVTGINRLNESDCGKKSGWIYKVNGKSPDHGCSQCVIKQGDRIVWEYTCTGE